MNINCLSYSFIDTKICRVANRFRGKESKFLFLYAAYAIKRNYLCSFLLLITVPFKIEKKFSYLSKKILLLAYATSKLY